ncbi:hypothetical protein CLOM_g18424 [Closterium sp. NIES-68]|nr:hypothetical protein CLOM_g18424 [Closterium sp. NIES-68]
MTPQADLLDEVKPPGKIKYVAAASGALLPVIGVGNAKVKGANGELVGLGNVLLVEGLSANLLSVRRLQKSKAEFSKFPFNSATGPAKTPLALVHMDVVGPTRAPSLSGSRYFLTIVDDHTRAVWVYPLNSKGEVAAAVLKEWMPRAQRECGHKVKQTKGKDYDEVFAPVGKGTTLRVLLAIAALLGWKIRQMDIVTAFLNGIILEEVYMKQPEGLDDGSGRVCRLKKAIYGLKQAPRAWYHKLEEALLAGGFKKNS